MKPKFYSLLTIIILFPVCLFSQTQKDTIYFDEDWSICEKPVAEYYRVCTLNKENQIYYKGNVQDYYINGKREMIGNYSDSGYKNGDFVFYNENGLVIKKGTFVNDEMKGDWYYYDSLGSLKAEFTCESSVDFTPLFLISESKDTLLKNGNGKFAFYIQEDLPGIFSIAEQYFFEGEVTDSLKNGEFDFAPKDKYGKADFFEIYKKGKFIKAKSYDETINTPLHLLHLTNYGLDRIDMFYHSNPVFGLGTNGDKKLIDFLINHNSPALEFSGKNFFDNDKIFFFIISKVLQHDLPIKLLTHPLSYHSFSDSVDVYGFDSSEYNIRNISGDIALTIDTSGNVIYSGFNTTLTSREINKINYYLSRIVGLVSYKNENEKSTVNANLKLETIVDTLADGKLDKMYIVYNSDISNIETAATTFAKNKGIQTEAKFPGGQYVWLIYLRRNLNFATPTDHGAPNGNYTVTVSFLVDENGNVSDVKAENNPGYGTAEEALRVIKKSPKWIPAIQDGRNVTYRQKENITFQVTTK